MARSDAFLRFVPKKKLMLAGSVFAMAMMLTAPFVQAETAPRAIPLAVKAGDVIPTGNEFLSLPTIRAVDGALENFNVLSMKDRGLLQVVGDHGTPALQPYFVVNNQPVVLKELRWELLEYWIPVAHLRSGDVEMTLTWCAPEESHGAFLHLTMTNAGSEKLPVAMGLKASWGGLQRVTYTPVALRGERTMAKALWMDAGESFSFIQDDTRFAWALLHSGSESNMLLPPQSVSPEDDMRKTATLAPGQTVSADYVLGVGLEEFSAPHSAKSLRERIDRFGADRVIADTATWCRKHTRTTGRPDLDLLMNRNLLFTALYAWGRTIDTEQFVGVTSRSPRYYVSAAYWDRDAMLWSFPALLDTDTEMARNALEYALSIQLRNTGVHSRFIDGVVLEDGFQLDEMVAPLIALGDYVKKTGDAAFLEEHRSAVALLRRNLLTHFDPETGLFWSLQDPQDEYQKMGFMTTDNVLTWKALLSLSELLAASKDSVGASEMRARAQALHGAIQKHCIFDGAPGAGGPIYALRTDGKDASFGEAPPGSLLRLPALGFVPESDPIFVRTAAWLHSANNPYSYSDKEYGLPGSYRLPISTAWSAADHLVLPSQRERALKVLLGGQWDGGIVSEGLDVTTGHMDSAGGAFATAAGYVGHAICETYCTDRTDTPRK